MKYRIEKDNHKSRWIPGFTTANVVEFDFRFLSGGDSAPFHLYNSLDINKIYGLSDSWSHHQDDSVRLGWRFNAGVIDLFAYCYVNGLRESKYICSINPYDKQKHRASVEIRQEEYLVIADGHFASISRKCTKGIRGPKYKLFPYFGGDETAPQDIEIEIVEI